MWQVLGIYLVGALLGYEAIEALVSGLGLPEWLPAFALVLFIIGLPIVLATAFVQEGGPAMKQRDPTLLPGAQEGLVAAAGAAGGRDGGVRRFFTWRHAIAGGVLAFALWGVVATGWLLFEERPERSSELGSENLASIAVLPFLNMSPDSANEYFSDGVTEEIITALSRLKGLRVMSRSATFRYKGTDIDPREVGRELGVATILEGSVRKEAARVRITAQLIDVANGFHLWSENYDRRYEAIFDIQDDVSEKIAEALRVRLTESDQESIQRRATEDLEAYEYYSRGRHEFYKYTPEGNAAAIGFFERALERDPNFALALAGLSLCQSQYINRGWSDDEEWLVKAEAAARRALEIDPHLAEAHFALGFVYERRRMYDEEEAEMKVVLTLNPNHAHGHDSLGDVYFSRGLLDEALVEYAIALRLDPFLPPSHYRTGAAYFFKGQFEEALRAYRKGLELIPEVNLLHLGMGNVLSEQGRHRTAVESYKAAIALEPEKPHEYVGLATALLALADLAGAESTADRLLRVGSKQDDRIKAAYDYILGRIQLAQGKPDSALALFERATSLDPLGGLQIGGGMFTNALYGAAVGEAHLAKGDALQAAEQFEAVLLRVPEWKILHYERARALERAGDVNAAAMEYRTFLESWKDADPDASALVDAKERLEALFSQSP